MRAIGYCRVSTDKQSEKGVSLEAQTEKIRAMAVVHGFELIEVVKDGESGKSLHRSGMQRVLEMVQRREVQAVIIAKLDRLTRSVKDLCELLELFEHRQVALISVAESLDTSSAAGRLVINIMAAVSQWEREAIGERTRDALQHKRGQGERVGNISRSVIVWLRMANTLNRTQVSRQCSVKFAAFAVPSCRCAGSPPL